MSAVLGRGRHSGMRCPSSSTRIRDEANARSCMRFKYAVELVIMLAHLGSWACSEYWPGSWESTQPIDLARPSGVNLKMPWHGVPS